GGVGAGPAAAAQFLGRFGGGFLRGARSACGSRQWQSPPPPGAAAPGEASVRVIRYGVGLRGCSLSRATSVLGWLRVGRYLRRACGLPRLAARHADLELPLPSRDGAQARGTIDLREADAVGNREVDDR